MAIILQINVTANWGSTGKITEDIGKVAMESGWESWIAYGRGTPISESNLIRIGNDWDMRFHVIQTRLLDNHGLASEWATKHFVKQLEKIKPDIIHLHNIHGYYLNYPILFDFLNKWGGPVVWTIHDIWPITGHCAYFGMHDCDKWKIECNKCDSLNLYPKSLFSDKSTENYNLKKHIFTSLPNLILIPVSNWIHDLLNRSFLSTVKKKIIHNGIDVSVFKPSGLSELQDNLLSDEPKKHFDPTFISTIKNQSKIDAQKLLLKNKQFLYYINQHRPLQNNTINYVLAVSSVWNQEKGYNDIIELRKVLDPNKPIIMVGISKEQQKNLPMGIIGIPRTKNQSELAILYSGADAFINPTWADNFPTVNLESLACGTPVITYDTGGSPEAVDANTGIIVERGNVEELHNAILTIKTKWGENNWIKCRTRCKECFNRYNQYQKYIDLYKTLI